MKNVIIFTLLVATLACNKKSDSDLKQSIKHNFFEIKDLLIGASVDPEAFVCAYSHLGSNGVRSYDFRAYFKSHPDSPHNYSVGALSCNGITVPMIAAENNTYVLQDNDGANSSFKNWLNNSLNISFTGIGSYTGGNITLEKHSEFTEFSLSNVSGNNNSFNKNGNLPVSWNSDPNNTDSVFIVVTYDYEVTKDFFNSTASPTPVINQIKVPDNGNCTLPASFFSTFPNNSFNRIEIYRGNYENFDVGTTGNPRSVGVLGYSKAVLKLLIL